MLSVTAVEPSQRPSLHRSNADKRQAVEMMFATLIEEFGSLEAIVSSTQRHHFPDTADWSALFVMFASARSVVLGK